MATVSRFTPSKSAILRLGKAGYSAWPIEDEIAELEELVSSSGCKIMGHISAKRHSPVAGTFLGEGKLVEIASKVQDLQAQTVIFSQELSPAQQRNIEDVLKAKVGVNEIAVVTVSPERSLKVAGA